MCGFKTYLNDNRNGSPNYSMLEIHQKSAQSSRGLFAAGLIVLLVMAAGFAIFYRHANQAKVQVMAGRVLPMPVHTKYGHVGRVAGPDQEEDSLYVLAEVKLEDATDAPLFLKDITGTFTTKEGGTVDSRRIGSEDLERLFTLLPQLKPLVQSTGLKPLDLEQKIPAHSTYDGYVLLLFAAPPQAWRDRQSAQINLGFYHQEPVTLTLPK